MSGLGGWEPGRSKSSLGRHGKTACEFQRQVEGRAAGQRGLLYLAGGACADGALRADLQPDQTTQLSGLPAADAWGPLACRPCPCACRTNITGGTNIGGRSFALTGRSKMACTGCSISLSEKIIPAYAKGTALKTLPSCVALHSIFSNRIKRPNSASRTRDSKPLGIAIISSCSFLTYSESSRLPYPELQLGLI